MTQRMYRLSTWSHGTKFWAMNPPSEGVRFTAQKSSARLYGREEARGIARRMQRVNSTLRLEVARDALREGLARRGITRNAS